MWGWPIIFSDADTLFDFFFVAGRVLALGPCRSCVCFYYISGKTCLTKISTFFLLLSIVFLEHLEHFSKEFFYCDLSFETKILEEKP